MLEWYRRLLIFGHPSGTRFKFIPEFVDHLNNLQLQSNGQANEACPCICCTQIARKRVDRGIRGTLAQLSFLTAAQNNHPQQSIQPPAAFRPSATSQGLQPAMALPIPPQPTGAAASTQRRAFPTPPMQPATAQPAPGIPALDLDFMSTQD